VRRTRGDRRVRLGRRTGRFGGIAGLGWVRDRGKLAGLRGSNLRLAGSISGFPGSSRFGKAPVFSNFPGSFRCFLCLGCVDFEFGLHGVGLDRAVAVDERVLSLSIQC
jgi:hypothetical protein